MYTTHQTDEVGNEDGDADPGGQRDAAVHLFSASKAARTMIRELIESGELCPGERLKADELGDRLGVSRTPIRDALHILRSEGLVEILPRKGVFVRSISAQEIEEVYAIKAAIEPIAAEWAAEQGSDESKRELSEILDLLLSAASSGNVAAAAQHVDQVHNKLFEMTDSSVLRDVYQVFHGRVKALRQLNMSQPGRLDTSVRQHAEIVKLVIDGDGAGAREVMARHMSDATASVRQVIS